MNLWLGQLRLERGPQTTGIDAPIAVRFAVDLQHGNLFAVPQGQGFVFEDVLVRELNPKGWRDSRIRALEFFDDTGDDRLGVFA